MFSSFMLRQSAREQASMMSQRAPMPLRNCASITAGAVQHQNVTIKNWSWKSLNCNLGKNVLCFTDESVVKTGYSHLFDT